MPTSASWRLWPRRWISRCSSAPSTSLPKPSAAARTWKRGPARALPRRQRGAALDVPARGSSALRGAHLHGSYRRRPHRELLHALHRGHWPRRFSAACSTATDPWCVPCSTSPATSCTTTSPLARRRGRPWSAMSPARSGARTPPTPTPTASAPMCATRSCRWPRNGTVRCPRC